MRSVLIALLGLSAGCYASHGVDGPMSVDGGGVDAGPRALDAGRADAGAPDAGAPDAGPLREPRWVELAVEGDAPPARLNHFAVYDAPRDRVLVFGGFDPYGDRGGCCLTPYIEHQDVWALELSTERWSQVGTLDRRLLAVFPSEVAVDDARGRLVFIGQESFDGGPSHTLALDLATWSLTRLPRGPWPGDAAPLRVAYDAGSHQLVANDAIFSDVTPGTWAFDLTSDGWEPLASVDRPQTRFHNPLSASGAGSFWMYGGFAHDGDTMAELWRYDRAGGAWTQVTLDVPRPGRWSHRAVFEPLRGALVVVAGNLWTRPQGTLLIDPDSGRTQDLELDPAPPGRRDFTLVLDTRRRRAIAFGGAEQSVRAYADTWALELP